MPSCRSPTATPGSASTCCSPCTPALFRFKLSTKRGAVQEGSPEFVRTVVMPFAQTFTRK